MTPVTSAISSDWRSARKKLSLSISAFNEFCDSLDKLNTQVGADDSALQELVPMLEAEMGLLDTERQRLLSSITNLKRLRNSLTPAKLITRLPQEVLAYIFTLAVNAGRTLEAHRSSHLQFPPDPAIVLSSVSSHWRHIALGLPELWTYVDLNRRAGLKYPKLWLERASDRPLFICFDQPQELEPDHVSFTELMLYPQRFGSLVLYVHHTLGQTILYDACVKAKESPKSLRMLALRASPRFPASCFYNTPIPSINQLDIYLSPVRTLFLEYTSVTTGPQLHSIVLSNSVSYPCPNMLSQTLINSYGSCGPAQPSVL
jgi:hypothetical protein